MIPGALRVGRRTGSGLVGSGPPSALPLVGQMQKGAGNLDEGRLFVAGSPPSWWTGCSIDYTVLVIQYRGRGECCRRPRIYCTMYAAIDVPNHVAVSNDHHGKSGGGLFHDLEENRDIPDSSRGHRARYEKTIIRSLRFVTTT